MQIQIGLKFKTRIRIQFDPQHWFYQCYLENTGRSSSTINIWKVYTSVVPFREEKPRLSPSLKIVYIEIKKKTIAFQNC